MSFRKNIILFENKPDFFINMTNFFYIFIFKMTYCSPSHNYKYTCFDKKALVNIANTYNNLNNDFIDTKLRKDVLY
jgi:hypothetical protein